MEPLRVLVGCEFSGVVRDAFTRAGHFAVSCDLLPTETPGLHIQCDIREILSDSQEWDLFVGHPPCRCLCTSGSQYWPMYEMKGEQQEAIDFFKLLYNAPIRRVCIENPVGIMSARLRQPDQYIQPWEYGHNETKKTGLWLKNLPLLYPTNVVRVRNGNLTPTGQNKIGPHPDRWRQRSRTYTGIAEAMASQWGGVL